MANPTSFQQLLNNMLPPKTINGVTYVPRLTTTTGDGAGAQVFGASRDGRHHGGIDVIYGSLETMGVRNLGTRDPVNQNVLIGSPVDGTLKIVTENPSLPGVKIAVIQGTDGIEYVIRHMSNLPLALNGQAVKAGTVIGTMSNVATVPVHDHMSAYTYTEVDGKVQRVAVDPYTLYQSNFDFSKTDMILLVDQKGVGYSTVGRYIPSQLITDKQRNPVVGPFSAYEDAPTVPVPIGGMQALRDYLVGLEGGGKYNAVNPAGALGAYQMLPATLQQIKFQDANGRWTGQDGVWSQEDFLANKAAQDHAFLLNVEAVKSQLRSNGAWAHLGETLSDGTVIIEGSLIGAGWLGAGNVGRYLDPANGFNRVDANGTSVAYRLRSFARFDPSLPDDNGGVTASTPPAATTSSAGGHWEYPTTPHNAMGDFSGAAEPVWVADTKDSSSASTSTTPPKISTSSATNTASVPAPKSDVTHNPDGSTTYGFTAKANSADGTIQRGDTVTQVFDAQGQLSYYSVTHREPGKNGETTVMERMPLAGPGEATSAFSQWVGDALQFQGQWDADGARVGDRYTTAGVTYSRSAADGSTHWLDPNGMTVDERVQQSLDQETLRRFSAAPPFTLEDPADNAVPLDSTPQPVTPQAVTPEPATPDPQQTSSLSSDALQALEAGLQQIAAMTSHPGVQYADASGYTDNGIISDAGPGTAEPSPTDTATPANPATASTAAQQTANALGLMNSILGGLQHWDGMNDLQRTAAVVSIYNALDKVNENALSGGSSADLGSVAGALGLLNALEQGNMGAALYSGLGLVESLTFSTAQGAGLVSSQLGGNFLPALGLVLAIDSGDPVAIASSGVALYGAMTSAAWAGPVGLGIALAGAVLGSLFADDDIPMREGLAHAAWDSAGNTIILTDQDNEGGGATATGWMASLVDALQGQLATAQDAAGNTHALVPDLLPAIGFAYDPDGFNLANGAQGFVYLRWTDEQGHSQTRYYDGAGNRGDGTGDTLAGDFMQHAQRAIAPDWAVATAAHYQQGQGIALPQAADSLPQHLSDGLQQSLQAITLDLPVESAFQTTPATSVNQALLDIDGDGYLERSQWLATDQQALAIDANGDQAITPDELLSLDGNTPSLHNLRWLDANCDQLIDTRDPAFAAIRLWRDGNADGRAVIPCKGRRLRKVSSLCKLSKSMPVACAERMHCVTFSRLTAV